MTNIIEKVYLFMFSKAQLFASELGVIASRKRMALMKDSDIYKRMRKTLCRYMMNKKVRWQLFYSISSSSGEKSFNSGKSRNSLRVILKVVAIL